VKSLLYTPFELTTNMRRKMQITMLQRLTDALQKKFNVSFAKGQTDKEDAINNIKAKTKRILE